MHTAKTTSRIGVFLPNWIGDVVMATPFLRALEGHYRGRAELIGIARPYVAEVLQGTSWLKQMFIYERPKAVVRGNWSLITQLKSLQLDSAILLTNSLRTGIMAWLSRARRRVGYARNLRSWLLTETLPVPTTGGVRQPISAVDYYLNIAAHLGCPIENRALELACTSQEIDLAEQAWQRLILPRERPVIAFHAAGGWGGTATAKAWPLEHFAALAKQIIQSYDADILVLCGPNEREAAAEMVRRADNPRVKSLAEQSPSIGLTKGCLQRCRLLVSTDSGPRHIATALQIPTIGLFGATDPRWAQTYHPAGLTIFNKLDCGPCAKQHCPLGHHKCMQEISVATVFSAVAQQMQQPFVKAA
jgi:heptosyltransferase II